jgi:hypothetical protein
MIEQIIEDRKLLGPGNDADKKALVEVSDVFIASLCRFSVLCSRYSTSCQFCVSIDYLPCFTKDFPVTSDPAVPFLCTG